MAKKMGVILAEALVAERKRQGINQQELVDRLAELGHPMSRVTLSKIEGKGTRARNISLEAAFAIAAALSVPPAVLFLGLGTEDRVAIAPKMVVHPHLASKWLRGSESPATTERFAWKLSEWRRASEPVRLYDELEAAQSQVREAESIASFAEDDQAGQYALSLQVAAFTELARVLRTMEDRGIQAPKMPDEWIAKLERLGSEV